MKKIEWHNYKWFGIVGGILLVIGYFVIFGQSDDFEVIEVDNLIKEEVVKDVVEEDEVKEVFIFVEVKGEVHHPGVYELPVDARVKNVLEMARLKPTANILPVNQSMKLRDEMVIYIPHIDEESDSSSYELLMIHTEEENNGLININTANINDLTTLNGIGEKTAQKIIEYREANGLFMNINDLKSVNGIGEKKFLNIEPYITIE